MVIPFGTCFFRAISTLLVVLAAVLPSSAGELVNKNRENIAILGYDPVAYFTEGRPVKGKADYEHKWQSAIWRFSNAQNRNRFASDPGQYAPRYGGFCAGAMARGRKRPVDPRAWVIIDGKLYLNFSRPVLDEFVKKPGANIARADAHWKRIGQGE